MCTTVQSLHFPRRVWYLTILLAALTITAWAETESEEQVIITIRERQFHPPTVVLHVGQKTVLILANDDVELHAFLPAGLFTDVTLALSGNAAPQFGKDGLQKLILPSHGRSEIRFTPSRTGVYPYLCDMPGHDMRGTIRLE